MPLVLISLAVIILDRVTKILVQSHLAEGESIPVVPGVMSLTYILNPGAAFGMLEHQRLFFILMTGCRHCRPVYFWRRIKEEAMSSNWVRLFPGRGRGKPHRPHRNGLCH